MARQSLSELLRDVEGLPGVIGIVDAVLRNADGSIAQHEHKHNLVTEQFRSYLASPNDGNLIDTNYVFINENTEPMHRKISAMRSALPGTFVQSITAAKDGPNRIWTYATVFAVNTGGYTNAFPGVHAIIAATVLSTAITQTPAQTLEVNYRLAFQRS